jgi:hypothetical protein
MPTDLYCSMLYESERDPTSPNKQYFSNNCLYLTNPSKKQYHYISLNHHPHLQKSIMNILAKHNLIDYGPILDPINTINRKQQR